MASAHTKPECCDICPCRIEDDFFDTKTVNGSWGYLCSQCNETEGIGQATHYVRVDASDRFVSTPYSRPRKVRTKRDELMDQVFGR